MGSGVEMASRAGITCGLWSVPKKNAMYKPTTTVLVNTCLIQRLLLFSVTSITSSFSFDTSLSSTVVVTPRMPCRAAWLKFEANDVP